MPTCLQRTTLGFAIVPSLTNGVQAAEPVAANAIGLPGAIANDTIRAEGTLHQVARASYAKQLADQGGADWDSKNIPGDGKDRWFQGLCLLGAYFHEKPEPILKGMGYAQTQTNHPSPEPPRLR